MRFWYESKMLIERSVAFSPDALHVLAGAAGILVAAALLRRALSSWAPWLLIFAVALFNEVVDVWAERWPSWGMQAGEGLRDLLLTMAVPTFLLVAFRIDPCGFAAGRRNSCRPGDGA